jgi:hypothetical protein
MESIQNVVNVWLYFGVNGYYDTVLDEIIVCLSFKDDFIKRGEVVTPYCANRSDTGQTPQGLVIEHLTTSSKAYSLA